MMNKKTWGAMAVTVAAATAAFALSGTSAQADPPAASSLVGVGSDTVEAVLNAFSGYNFGTAYTPLQSSAGTGQRQLTSYDALNPAGADPCLVSVKPGGPGFNRPNGSGAGKKALSRAIDGTGWGSAACGGPVDVSGQIDFARSSSGPAAAELPGTALAYIPLGRDALSFATVKASSPNTAVTSLTRNQIIQIFSSATQPVTIAGATWYACGLQTSSGTFAFWNTVNGGATTEATSTTVCNAFGGTGRMQENDGTALAAKAAAAEAATPGSQVIAGFSAAAFVATSNGVRAGAPPASVKMGTITDTSATTTPNGVNIGDPVTGTAPNVVPSATFYNDATFGRNVYVVIPNALATAAGNSDIKDLFVGPTSAMCTAATQVTTNKFGFLTSPSCGVITQTSTLVTGQI